MEIPEAQDVTIDEFKKTEVPKVKRGPNKMTLKIEAAIKRAIEGTAAKFAFCLSGEPTPEQVAECLKFARQVRRVAKELGLTERIVVKVVGTDVYLGPTL